VIRFELLKKIVASLADGVITLSSAQARDSGRTHAHTNRVLKQSSGDFFKTVWCLRVRGKASKRTQDKTYI
jgi:hypothetical protein